VSEKLFLFIAKKEEYRVLQKV